MAGEEGRKLGKEKKEGLSPGEKRRLRQLVICLILFGVIFVGRGVNFEPVARLSSTIGALVRGSTDFQAVFVQMGESFSNGESAVETFHALWSDIRDGVQGPNGATEGGDNEENRAESAVPNRSTSMAESSVKKVPEKGPKEVAREPGLRTAIACRQEALRG